jgi:hypothetical protein
MNGRELTVLRTKLWELNIEYSGLVRAKRGEDALVRMEELRAERRALMALIAERREERPYPALVAVGSAALSIDAPPALSP